MIVLLLVSLCLSSLASRSRFFRSSHLHFRKELLIAAVVSVLIFMVALMTLLWSLPDLGPEFTYVVPTVVLADIRIRYRSLISLLIGGADSFYAVRVHPIRSPPNDRGFELPGGRIDGQTITEAVIRQVRQQTGFKVKAEEILSWRRLSDDYPHIRVATIQITTSWLGAYGPSGELDGTPWELREIPSVMTGTFGVIRSLDARVVLIPEAHLQQYSNAYYNYHHYGTLPT